MGRFDYQLRQRGEYYPYEIQLQQARKDTKKDAAPSNVEDAEQQQTSDVPASNVTPEGPQVGEMVRKIAGGSGHDGEVPVGCIGVVVDRHYSNGSVILCIPGGWHTRWIHASWLAPLPNEDDVCIARWVYPDKGVYDGQWARAGLPARKPGSSCMEYSIVREGYGIYRSPNNDTYEGEWRDDAPYEGEVYPLTSIFGGSLKGRETERRLRDTKAIRLGQWSDVQAEARDLFNTECIRFNTAPSRATPRPPPRGIVGYGGDHHPRSWTHVMR